MITVKLFCQTCGNEFEFSPQDYSIKGLQFIPKHCTACLDKRGGLRKIVLKRRCLKNWEGVYVENIKWLTDGVIGEKGLYKLHFFGGPNTGPWGGASFSHKWLIFVNKNLTFPAIVDIRLMSKDYQIEGEEKVRENEYVSIEKSEKNEPAYYLYLLEDYRKYTLKGFGRNRNWSERLQPIEEKEEFMVEDVIITTSGARSGRYGNYRKWVISNTPCKVIGDGVR